MLEQLDLKGPIITTDTMVTQMRSLFFATLTLFAKFVLTQSISTAGTDGKDIAIAIRLAQLPMVIFS